jgi:hypothetical protein
MLRRVDLVWTDVSEERIASIFRVEKSASEELAWVVSRCRNVFSFLGNTLILSLATRSSNVLSSSVAYALDFKIPAFRHCLPSVARQWSFTSRCLAMDVLSVTILLAVDMISKAIVSMRSVEHNISIYYFCHGIVWPVHFTIPGLITITTSAENDNLWCSPSIKSLVS